MKDTKNRIKRRQTNILDEMTEYIDDAVYYADIIDHFGGSEVFHV